MRVSTIELLLQRGADPNHKSKDKGNTACHDLLEKERYNKENMLSILVLMAKFKANFEQPNLQQETVFGKAAKLGIHLQDYATFCALLEREESVADTDNDDKTSLTTLNQPTLKGDTRSEINCEDEHVDFSGLDCYKEEPEDLPDSSDEEESVP